MTYLLNDVVHSTPITQPSELVFKFIIKVLN